MTDLFQVPESKSPRLLWMEKMKEEHRIFTHHAPGAGEWLALPMLEACELLRDYELTEKEKTDGPEMLAGYCRLLDDMHCIADNCETEFDAIMKLAVYFKWKLWS